MKNIYIHPSADVQSNTIGINTKIWQFVVILEGAKIGHDVNICSHCFIDNNVIVGNRVTIKSGIQLWDGVTIEDDVFIGPNTTFGNDLPPRSKKYLKGPTKTLIHKGASIGANATILPGLVIGQNSIIEAGTTVTRSVPAHAIVAGNPARIVGYTNIISKKTKSVSIKGSANEKIKSKVGGVLLYKFKKIEDLRGNLSVCEFDKDIPFKPLRHFLISDVPSSEIRGEHAHLICQQFLVAVKGSIHVTVDDGKHKDLFVLNKNNYGLYLPPKTWATQYNFSADSVLLVFASHPYSEVDYIREYDDFLKTINK